ncbi:hypothetical protein [Modestobacter sp. SYSU DS0875]
MLPQDLEARLRIALTSTIVEEFSLFVATPPGTLPSERAFAAQLAFRLRHVLENDWDIDVDHNSWPTSGNRYPSTAEAHTPNTSNLTIHRRGRSGRADNLLRLQLRMQNSRHDEEELQQPSEPVVAQEYRYDIALNLHYAHVAGGGEPPVVLLPTWYWAGAEGSSSDVYTEHAALSICRRGYDRLLSTDGSTERVTIRWPRSLDVHADDEDRRVEVLPQLNIRYGDWIRGDVTSAALVQLRHSVFLETVHHRHTRLDDGLVRVDDLSPYLDAEDPVELNAARFLKWDDVTIIMITNLIEEDIAQMIAASDLTEQEYFKSL